MGMNKCPKCNGSGIYNTPSVAMFPGSLEFGPGKNSTVEQAKEAIISGRVHANGSVGVILKINGGGDPNSLHFECLNNSTELIGEFDTLEAAISFAARYKKQTRKVT